MYYNLVLVTMTVERLFWLSLWFRTTTGSSGCRSPSAWRSTTSTTSCNTSNLLSRSAQEILHSVLVIIYPFVWLFTSDVLPIISSFISIIISTKLSEQKCFYTCGKSFPCFDLLWDLLSNAWIIILSWVCGWDGWSISVLTALHSLTCPYAAVLIFSTRLTTHHTPQSDVHLKRSAHWQHSTLICLSSECIANVFKRWVETPDKIKLDVWEEDLSFSTKHLFCPEVPGLKIFRDLQPT